MLSARLRAGNIFEERGHMSEKARKAYTFIGIGLLICVLLALMFLYHRNRQANTPVQSADFVMDTFVSQTLYGQADPQPGYDLLHALEGKLSMQLEGSDIARVNAGAGEWVPVSEETFDLLSRCPDYAALSGGAFDVTIAPLTGLWDIGGEAPAVPAQGEIDAALKKVGIAGLELREADRSVRLTKPGMGIDLGGIAKGYALDLLADLYEGAGITRALVNMGSSIWLCGAPPKGEYTVAIRDPFEPQGGGYAGVLALSSCFISTSGTYERYFEQGGVRYHHIFDPATGYPAQTDLVSVTVVADSGELSEVLSTMILMEGKARLSENLARYDAVAIDGTGAVYASDTLAGKLTLSEGFEPGVAP